MRHRLALLLLAYLVVVGGLSLRRHLGMNSSLFDLGVHEQILHVIAHGLPPYLSTRGLPWLADHFSPIAYLLAPFYRLWPSPVGLILGQTLALGLGMVPVYRLASRRLGQAGGLWMAALYLSQPVLHYASRFDVHFSALALPLWLFAVDYLEQRRVLPFLACALLILTTGEAAGFSLLGLAWPAYRSAGWRWGLGSAILGGVGLWIASHSMARWGGGATQYLALYAPYGTSAGSVLERLATAPQEWLPHLLDPRYLSELLLPFAFLPLLAPGRLLPALPVVLGNVLSWRPAQHGIEYHYAAGILPFVAWAAVEGAARARAWVEPSHRMSALAWVVAISATVGFLVGPFTPWSEEAPRPQAGELRAALASLPRGASVSVQNTPGAHLGAREQLFLFPNPMQPAAWGNRPQSLAEQTEKGLHPPLPGEARRSLEQVSVDCFVLMPAGRSFPLDPGDLVHYLQALEDDPGYTASHREPVLIFRKGPPEPHREQGPGS
ncbi:MAG: DUF2079 domain-containing protein [Candidatus Eremiobacterota bacterium]